jgi:hypothetical protein
MVRQAPKVQRVNKEFLVPKVILVLLARKVPQVSAAHKVRLDKMDWLVCQGMRVKKDNPVSQEQAEMRGDGAKKVKMDSQDLLVQTVLLDPKAKLEDQVSLEWKVILESLDFEVYPVILATQELQD